jgi:UDP-N-acetylmuramyl pentapeptide phosphotransferase/UDP-N-acetylglucosamine-1-phosphate transferase
VVLCIAAGALVVLPPFFALILLGRIIRSPLPDQEGPWGAVLLVSLVVVAFLAPPVLDSLRDVARRSGELRVVVVRLSTLAIIVAAVTITSLIGGETAEAGMFMVPVSAASAAAIAVLAMVDGRRARVRHPARSI